MRKNFDYSDIRKQVLEFLSSLDIQPYDEKDIVLDGNLHRYRIHDDKPNNKSGAICIHIDGWPAGFAMDWRKDLRETWRYDITGLEIDEEQRAYYNSEEYRQKCEEEHRKKEEERESRRLAASERARREFECLDEPPEEHAYLVRKKVKSYGLKYNPSKCELAVPLRRINGLIFSLQWIPASEDRHKLFYEGAEMSGAFFSIGLETLQHNPEQTILLGEGYATMAKVYELTNQPVVAAMSCNRLKEIAKILHETYPDSKIVITADNDHKTECKIERNPGLLYANLTVQAKLAAGIAAPDFKDDEDGSDWDDYALIHGDEETARVLADKIYEAENFALKQKYKALVEKLGELKHETFAEFIQPPKDSNWLIENWMLSEGFGMVFGASGCGKSFMMLDMAFAIACEDIKEWHGEKILEHGTVIYFAGEGQRGMKKRCAGLCAALGIDPEKVKIHVISNMLAIDDENSETGVDLAIANIGNICLNPALVIFDTMSRYMAGDENKSVDANRYVACCEKIRHEFNCMVLTVHHTGLSPNAQDRGRGSSSFRGSADIQLFVSKNGSVITLQEKKVKDNEELNKKLVMKKIDVPNYFNADGSLDTTCMIVDSDEAVESTLLSPEGETVEDKAPVKKLSDSEKFAKMSYSEAVKKYGLLIYNEEQKTYVVAVRLEDWRKVFHSLSESENPETRRRQFTRARNAMEGKLGLLFMRTIDDEEYCLLIPSGNAYEVELQLYLNRKTEKAGQDATKEN